MKNFRRKLARVFGLALRSDLEEVNKCYQRMCRANDNSQSEAYRYRKLWKDTQRSYNEVCSDLIVLENLTGLNVKKINND